MSAENEHDAIALGMLLSDVGLRKVITSNKRGLQKVAKAESEVTRAIQSRL